MVKKAGDEINAVVDPESEAWNVAKGFTTLKILQPMVALDRYENIALYGSVEMDDFPNGLPDVSERRVIGLRRFLTTLRQLIGNVQFAMKWEDRGRIQIYVDRINMVERVLDGVSSHEENTVTHEKEFVINEKFFNHCFKILREIKDSFNFQMNKANLIFRISEDIDLDSLMADISEGG